MTPVHSNKSIKGAFRAGVRYVLVEYTGHLNERQ